MNNYICQPAYVLTNQDSIIVDDSLPGCSLQCLDDCREEAWVKRYLHTGFARHGYTPNTQSRGGYALKVEDGFESPDPLRTCFYITQDRVSQKPHNLVVIGDNARVRLISTCKSYNENVSSHLGDTELFIGKNSSVELFMIHSWNHKTRVAPRTVVIMDEGSYFQDNYSLIQSPSYYSFHPMIYSSDRCKVEAHSRCEFNGTDRGTIGCSVYMEGSGISADINGSSIANNSRITNPFSIDCRGEDNYGHVVCDGVLLDNNSEIHATPALTNASLSSNLSHEASIGSLNRQQLAYLNSRGLDQQEATELLIHSHLSNSIDWVPDNVLKEVQGA